MRWRYECADCGREHSERHADYCSVCGAPVLASPLDLAAGELASPEPGVWRYQAHLPPVGEQYRYTLGEAAAPVVEAAQLGWELGLRRLFLLCDHLSPTGSFKDRALAMTVGCALEAGAPGVVCASSGNAAGSAAAYAARAGCPAVIVVPEDVPVGKLGLARAFGAIALRVAGDYSHTFALGRELSAELGFVNVSTTYVNPNGVVAYRTVSFDIARQLGGFVDRVVVPTGAGPLVHGVVSGFEYLRARGDIAGLPRVDAVQPQGCAPIAAAFRAGRSRVDAWEQVTTEVSGIDDPLRGYPGDGSVTLRSLMATGGSAVAVADADVFAAGRRLAREFGQFVEPAAASTLAALEQLSRTDRLSEDETVVCLLTGHGLKTQRINETPAPVVQSVADAASRLAEAGVAARGALP